LIMVVLYIFIFYDARLYSDVGLQVIYIFLQVYGWYEWLYGGKKKTELPVSILNRRSRILWGIIIILGSCLLGYSMYTYTNAAFPYLDAFITIASLVAQWFLARKKLENWMLWITVDVVAIGVYFLKNLYFTTGLYIVFFGLAIMGLREWQNAYKKQQV
jgi:nicotinamide mononucleotide transporter